MRPGQVMVIGCGNILFGDDGFGPGVIEYLRVGRRLPEGVELVDAGTGAGDLLLDVLLGENGLKKMILLDAVDLGYPPGTVVEIPLENIPLKKKANYSVHQFPALDILMELKNRKGVDVHLWGCQVETIPGEICPGLSPPVEKSLPVAAKIVYEMVLSKNE